MDPAAALRKIRAARLILTVTPGRSGTTLLTRLLSDCMGVQAEHEAAPRLNYVLRTVQAAPHAARLWLRGEKLPAIAARLDGRPYADISHLYCKGFLEPLIDLEIRPEVIVLTRPAAEVAESLLAVGAVPQRSAAGRMVLVGPNDPGVVVPAQWRDWDRYQLCFWYAREIERRQRHYMAWLPGQGCRVIAVAMTDLTSVDTIRPLLRFVTGGTELETGAFAAVVGETQNPRSAFPRRGPAPGPDRAAREAAVDAALAACGAS